MTPTPYLTFHGTCRQAMARYAEVFGGEITAMMSARDLPPGSMPIPEDKADWIMHAALRIGGGEILASDDVTGATPAMAGCSVYMALPTAEAGLTVFDRLSDGGQVTMPYQKTFWSAGFGMLRDRFGVNWMISTTAAPA